MKYVFSLKIPAFFFFKQTQTSFQIKAKFTFPHPSHNNNKKKKASKISFSQKILSQSWRKFESEYWLTQTSESGTFFLGVCHKGQNEEFLSNTEYLRD